VLRWGEHLIVLPRSVQVTGYKQAAGGRHCTVLEGTGYACMLPKQGRLSRCLGGLPVNCTFFTAVPGSVPTMCGLTAVCCSCSVCAVAASHLYTRCTVLTVL
jgi:hypothetical protein